MGRSTRERVERDESENGKRPIVTRYSVRVCAITAHYTCYINVNMHARVYSRLHEENEGAKVALSGDVPTKINSRD